MSIKCREILEEANFNEKEQRFIDSLADEGKTPDQVRNIILEAMEDGTLRDISDVVSRQKTDDYLEKLKNIVYESDNPYKEIFNLLVGDAMGVTSRALTRAQSRFGHFASILEDSNSSIKRLLNQPKFVAHLLKELDGWTPKSKTGNTRAHKFAKAIIDWQTTQVQEMNKFGAGVNIRDDYITKQWHDTFRMMSAGEDQWVDDIFKRLDYEKTKTQMLNILEERGIKLKKGEEFDMHKYLRSAYKQMTGEGADEGMLLQYLRMRRTFAFKSTDDLIAYNTKYGHDNMAHAIMENMTLIDNNIALGEAMGYGYKISKTPDDVTLKRLEDELAEAKKLEQPEAIKEARKNLRLATEEEINPITKTKIVLDLLHDQGKINDRQLRRLRGALAQVSGDAYMIARPTVAKFVMGFQFMEYLTKLGKATLTSINDQWTSALLLHFQGTKPGQGYMGLANHILRKAFRTISEAERDIFLRQLNVGVDGIFESYSRNFINNPKMGLLNTMTDKMFDWNLLNWWTNASREGLGKMMSNNFANKLDLSYEALAKTKDGKRFRDLISDYGIGEKQWEELRKIGAFDETLFKGKKGSKKVKYITSDWIKDNGGSKELRESINRFFVMESRLGVPEASAADRVWMFGDHKRGSLPETTMRLFFQFRTHQVKFVRALMPRMYDMGLPSLMHVLPALTFGYVSISLKNMVAGKLPPAHNDPDTLTDALVYSGMAGFIGDFIGGQYGRYQHEVDEVIGGSAYSTFKGWAELASGLAKGDKNASDVWKDLRHNIPYSNLFWTEALINYSLHYGVMETMTPGYLRRMEAREEGTNNGFLVNPSSFWSYGGFR